MLKLKGDHLEKFLRAAIAAYYSKAGINLNDDDAVRFMCQSAERYMEEQEIGLYKEAV